MEMYFFTLGFPLLVMCALASLGVTARNASPTGETSTHKRNKKRRMTLLQAVMAPRVSVSSFFVSISALCVLYVPALSFLFWVSGDSARKHFSFLLTLQYSFVGIVLPVLFSLVLIFVIREAPWWRKEYNFYAVCIAELWTSFLFLLLMWKSMTQIEYFLFPIARLSLSFAFVSYDARHWIRDVVMFGIASFVACMAGSSALFLHTIMAIYLLVLVVIYSCTMFSFYYVARSKERRMR